jgi:TolB-like protein/tetratricopeptide (TPR) repeat protein
LLLAVVVMFLGFAGAGRLLNDQNAVTTSSTLPVAYSPEDRRQSVVVLPFENSSGDSAQDNLAASLTRDLTDQIATDSTVPLVPAPAAAAYRGKPLDLRALRRNHDVHFAIAGSARRESGHVIVVVNMFDTADDRSVWSGSFNRDDRPGSLADIANAVAAGFDQGSMDAEVTHAMQEHASNLDKRDLMFAANTTAVVAPSKEHYLIRLAFVNRALALDTNYVWALRMKGRLLADFVRGGYSTNRDADLASALASVDKALQLAPNDWTSLREKARVLRAKGDWDGAAALLRSLIERKPLAAYRYFDLATILIVQGHAQEALTNMLTAKRLLVAGDDVASVDSYLSVVLLANDRFDEAAAQARLAAGETTPENVRFGEYPWLVLIAAEHALGHVAEAKADLKRFLAMPRSLATLAAVQMDSLSAVPQLLDGLRETGMPEQ